MVFLFVFHFLLRQETISFFKVADHIVLLVPGDKKEYWRLNGVASQGNVNTVQCNACEGEALSVLQFKSVRDSMKLEQGKKVRLVLKNNKLCIEKL